MQQARDEYGNNRKGPDNGILFSFLSLACACTRTSIFFLFLPRTYTHTLSPSKHQGHSLVLARSYTCLFLSLGFFVVVGVPWSSYRPLSLSYKHTCMHTNIHTNIHTCKHTHMHTNKHACMHTIIHVAYVHIPTYLPAIPTSYIYRSNRLPHAHACMHTITHVVQAYIPNIYPPTLPTPYIHKEQSTPSYTHSRHLSCTVYIQIRIRMLYAHIYICIGLTPMHWSLGKNVVDSYIESVQSPSQVTLSSEVSNTYVYIQSIHVYIQYMYIYSRPLMSRCLAR